MPRYIDADAFIQFVETNESIIKVGSRNGKSFHTGRAVERYYILDLLRNAPTVSPDDVRGVGKWEKDSDGLDVCSECGEIALQRVFIKLPDKIVDLQMVRSKFCPNCGARLEVSEDA